MQLLQNPLMFSHVVLGALAVVAGAIALLSKKGAATHIKFGRLFAVAMILSALLGVMFGLFNYQALLITAFGGALSLTLIASSLLTIKDGTHIPSQTSYSVAALNGVNTLAVLSCGLIALRDPSGTLYGFAAADYLFLGAMASVALIGDILYFVNKPKAYNRRTARHLWRMSLGFFIAAGSAFTGPGMSAFPESVQNSGVLSLPELLIFVAMLFWFIKTRFFAKT